ncbi:fumarylacetoacetate hydrolase family protein [Pseudonocardia kujensis]|uniref:fumarylacetoacetate hydrolase family protein n=1 Tax=Pseudonocardia kujensis TaxID=1128675 RepID=UPI001E4B1AAF|nr:fumarylacetoacetate hydrolase family protein [Pseudonocardia kujensis]MCE0762048.1 fumarylacetoacetate hydrolase family protein [Pseudonocardia kujensis]
MHLATFDDDRLGVVLDDRIVDVSDVVDGTDDTRGTGGGGLGAGRMRRYIADPRPEEVAAAARARPGRPLAEVTLRAPVPDPRVIVAAPVNYLDHQQEMRESADVGALGFFLKAPSSLLGDGGTVRLPYGDRRFDHEAEIAVVIGRETRHVREADALDHVFGYTGLLDITMRGGEDRSIRKSFDTFTPCGPWIATPDELADPTDVAFSLTNNGELRQKASTSGLIWGVARFVAYVSTVLTLRPGDILSTGTPAGVSPLLDGDVVSMRADGIGTLTVRVDGSSTTPSPTRGHHSGPTPPPGDRGGAR